MPARRQQRAEPGRRRDRKATLSKSARSRLAIVAAPSAPCRGRRPQFRGGCRDHADVEPLVASCRRGCRGRGGPASPRWTAGPEGCRPISTPARRGAPRGLLSPTTQSAMRERSFAAGQQWRPSARHGRSRYQRRAFGGGIVADQAQMVKAVCPVQHDVRRPRSQAQPRAAMTTSRASSGNAHPALRGNQEKLDGGRVEIASAST